jgi:hypothetical protein
MTVTSTPCDIEVVTFVTSPGAYYFVLGDCRRADVVKCRSMQPTIHDHNNYSAYLWVQAFQGYFVLRQRFVDHVAQEWRVIRELEVSEPAFDFFETFGDQLLAELEQAEQEGP